MISMAEEIHFQGYRFDPATQSLWSGEQEIRLTPKASAVLNMLVSHAGRPVSKEELFAVVWSGTAVSDDALTSCIQELRKAFADDAKKPRFIETRHRRGYQFVASLSKVTGSAAQPPAAQPINAIAVLPFVDMSPAHDQDYFCDGIAEELINTLTHISGLRVAARTASFQFRDPGADVRAIARQLGVGTLLEGSVRKADDRLRVTVQLIEAATGYHRWSKRFDSVLGDVFAIQDQISESVATSLRGDVLSEVEKLALHRPQTTAEAYEHYLRGRQCLPRMSHQDLERSAQAFELAIAADGAYGPAFAGLATVHATLYEWYGAKEDDLERAERASQKALELAPGLAEAHVARGFTLSLSRRYEEASREFESATSLNPNLFDAYYYFARVAFACGQVLRSAELFQRASEVRQEDFQSPVLLAQSLRMLGRTEESITASREGVRRAEHALELNPLDARALSLGGAELRYVGQRERGLEWLNRALELCPDDVSTLFNGATHHASLGHREEALNLLDRAIGRGWGHRDWLEHDPDYDFVREDPRFQNLLAKLK